MEAVKLKLNEAKTEFIYFGSRLQLNKTTHITINAIGELIEVSTKARYLGGHLDYNLTFREHILSKCKATTLNIIKIHNIRKYLTKETCHKLISTAGHITHRLCKLNASRTTISKYKTHAQNPKHSCKTNPWKNATESTTECLKSLHWLPIQQRMDYKICTLIHKWHNLKAPVHLKSNTREKKTNCPCLRSENKKALLAVPHMRKHTFASRSFSIYGPNLWNSLPNRIRGEIIFEEFKKKLKTHFFTTAYM